MSRPLRISYEGAFLHITNRGASKRSVFLTDDDRDDFLRLLARANDRFGIEVNAFCLMHTHFHLVLKVPEGNLSEAMHQVKSTYVRNFNKRNGFDGPLFGDRFFSKLIETEGYAHRAVVYVERNPLEAGMVEDLPTYQWSSYRLFLGPRVSRPLWLSDEALRIGGILSRAELRRSVERPRPADTLDMTKFPEVIGSPSFIAAALDNAEVDDQTVGHYRRGQIRPTLAEVDSAVTSVLNVSNDQLFARIPGQRNAARMIAIGLSQDVGSATLAQIAEHYGFSTAQSAGVMTSRYRAFLATDQLFSTRVDQIRQILKSPPSQRVAV